MVGVSGLAFFKRADDPWEFKSIESLEGRSIAVVQGYSYSEEIDAWIAANPQRVRATAGDVANRTNLRLLLSDRVDLVLEDINVTAWTARSMKVEAQIANAGATAEPLPVYVAFAPKGVMAKASAAEFDAGMKRLRTSGELATILARYGVSDWVDTTTP
jgi:polar amino acid transport system substrate-binding protein